MRRSMFEMKMDILKVVNENQGDPTTKMFNACNMQCTLFLSFAHALAHSGLLKIEKSNDPSDKRLKINIQITSNGKAVLKKYEEILAALK